MNLWFRLIRLLLSFPWKNRAGAMDTRVITMRAWPTDLDLNRHVTNSRYFAMADISRIDLMLSSGAVKVAMQHKAAPIVGDTMAKFRKELKLFQRFEIHGRIVGWDDKWIFLEHRFVCNGETYGTIIVRGVFRSRAGLISPQVFVQNLGLPSQSPELPQWVSIWSESCDQLSDAMKAQNQ